MAQHTVKAHQSQTALRDRLDVSVELSIRLNQLNSAGPQVIHEDFDGSGLGFFLENQEIRMWKVFGEEFVAYNLAADPARLLNTPLSENLIDLVGTISQSGTKIELFINGHSVGIGSGNRLGSDQVRSNSRFGSLDAVFDGEVLKHRVYQNEVLSPDPISQPVVSTEDEPEIFSVCGRIFRVDDKVSVIKSSDESTRFTISRNEDAPATNDGSIMDNFKIVLDSEPADDVVITIINPPIDEVFEGGGNNTTKAKKEPPVPTVLKFSPSDWNTEKTVTLVTHEDVIGDSLLYEVVFEEEVLNVKAEDFQVTGGSAAQVAEVVTYDNLTFLVEISGDDLREFFGKVGIAFLPQREFKEVTLEVSFDTPVYDINIETFNVVGSDAVVTEVTETTPGIYAITVYGDDLDEKKDLLSIEYNPAEIKQGEIEF